MKAGFSILFVGEERSNRAIQMGVRWEDGRLAAKQLFDALIANGIDPKRQKFTNLFERGGLSVIKRHSGTVVAMGNKVSKDLSLRKIQHIKIVHPAAKGLIRRKENYINHIKESLVNKIAHENSNISHISRYTPEGR